MIFKPMLLAASTVAAASILSADMGGSPPAAIAQILLDRDTVPALCILDRSATTTQTLYITKQRCDAIPLKDERVQLHIATNLGLISFETAVGKPVLLKIFNDLRPSSWVVQAVKQVDYTMQIILHDRQTNRNATIAVSFRS